VNSRESKIINNKFINITMGAAGFAVFGLCDNVEVSGNIFSGMRTTYEMYVQQSTNISIFNNSFNASGYTESEQESTQGLSIKNSRSIIVSNNIFDFKRWQDLPIGIMDWSGEDFDGNKVLIYNTSEITITDNSIIGGDNAIAIPSVNAFDTSTTFSNITISNNRISGTSGGAVIDIGKAGSTINQISGLKILNNTIKDVGTFDTGVIKIGTSFPNKVKDITITWNNISNIIGGGSASAIWLENTGNSLISNNILTIKGNCSSFCHVNNLMS
jgi:hypothetical protein